MEDKLLEIGTRGGPAAGLALFILALLRKWVVLGWQYDTLKKDRDEWKALAMEAAGLAEIAATANRRI